MGFIAMGKLWERVEKLFFKSLKARKVGNLERTFKSMHPGSVDFLLTFFVCVDYVIIIFVVGEKVVEALVAYLHCLLQYYNTDNY